MAQEVDVQYENLNSPFVHYAGTCARSTTIQHWQLRDLITCKQPDELFCVHQHSTVLYNVRADRSTVVQDLLFGPTSMTVGGGYIAAGGHNSQLDVRHLATGEVMFRGTVGGSVNNALHIAKDLSGEQRLFVCNNDNTIKVYNLADMQAPVTAVRCPTPINYAALSKGLGLLACVGDCPEAMLYKATESGYAEAGTYCEFGDAGMSAAWNATGTCFAAASQDGKVCVWDPRGKRAVARLQAGSACRGVKYSSGPADLLVFSEHENYCHIVDARKYTESQVLKVHPNGCQISGICFAPSGRRLYVGMGELGIGVYDIDMVKRTTFSTYELA
eukprot:jgi/Botrbrau1/7058/Bobra.0165s0081.1